MGYKSTLVDMPKHFVLEGNIMIKFDISANGKNMEKARKYNVADIDNVVDLSLLAHMNWAWTVNEIFRLADIRIHDVPTEEMLSGKAFPKGFAKTFGDVLEGVVFEDRHNNDGKYNMYPKFPIGTIVESISHDGPVFKGDDRIITSVLSVKVPGRDTFLIELEEHEYWRYAPHGHSYYCEWTNIRRL